MAEDGPGSVVIDHWAHIPLVLTGRTPGTVCHAFSISSPLCFSVTEHGTQGLSSLSGRMSYHKISWSLERRDLG